VIVVDANLLLYAYDSSSPAHDRARAWWEGALNEDEPVGLALVTILAFLRIGTNPGVFRNPLTPAEGIATVTTWLDRPRVGIVEPTEFHWSTMDELCRTGQARGPLLMDAHLAALAMEHGALLHTSDRGFARFPKLRFVDPLTGSDGHATAG
jgi:toxin-antitoxin system PIN domain toxin